jgi:hypothetical protein
MADESTWFYTMGGQQQGPVPLDHLKHWLTSGQLQPTELVWRDGMPNWIAAQEVPELQGFAPAMTGAAAAAFQQAQQPVGYAQPVNYQTQYYGQDARILSQVSQARTAMICGIIGVFCLFIGFIFGLIAVIQASLALGSMKNTRSEEGKGMAIAGLVLGILDILGHCGFSSLRFRHF